MEDLGYTIIQEAEESPTVNSQGYNITLLGE
jgi:hypothetical protein